MFDRKKKVLAGSVALVPLLMLPLGVPIAMLASCKSEENKMQSVDGGIRAVIAKVEEGSFDQLNEHCKKIVGKGSFEAGSMDVPIADLAKSLGVIRIHVTSPEVPYRILYDVAYHGMVTSGSAWSVLYSERHEEPTVADLLNERKSGDSRVILYQKLSNGEKWYIRNVAN